MSLAFKRRVKKPLSSDRASTNAHRTFRKVVVFFFLFVGLFRWYRESGVSSSASNLCIVFESSFTKCSSDPKMEIREQLPCEREFRIGGRARFRGLHEEFFGRDEWMTRSRRSEWLANVYFSRFFKHCPFQFCCPFLITGGRKVTAEWKWKDCGANCRKFGQLMNASSLCHLRGRSQREEKPLMIWK